MDFIPIKNYETYAINKNGEVLDLRSKKLLKQYNNLNGGGYLQVQLINENGYKNFKIHRLVGETFIPNPDNKKTIDHIDRNRHNNNIENLRWATHTEQNINTHSKGKIPYKYIIWEDTKSKNGNSFYRIVILNDKIKYRKRFDVSKYSLEDVVKIRNDILKENNIIIVE